jgi:hypothetical protein
VPQRPASPLWSTLALDRSATASLQDQIVGYFRDAVLSGRLKGGARVPSSRFPEGNRVLPVPRFPCGLAIACEDMVAEEERRSTCSCRPSVWTRPRPKAGVATAMDSREKEIRPRGRKASAAQPN